MRRASHSSVPIFVLVGILAGFASPVLAQQASERVDALKSLSIEELASLDVTTASRRLQRLADVPAAISVVTAEDLRRSVATSLPEALRLVHGLNVARFDGRTWAVSARGFNISTSNKMLTMMDGRSLWTPLFSGTLWDEHDALIADIERIEVVRGPGGTLWGANAVNGVINIVTRPATDTIGTYAVVSAGSEDRLIAGFRHGRAIGNTGAWRAYAKVSWIDETRFADGTPSGDDQQRLLVGGRADWATGDDAFVLQGDAYVARLGLFGRDDTPIRGGYLRGLWTHTISPRAEFRIQGTADFAARSVENQFEEERGSAGLDVQHRFVTARHDFMSGGSIEVTRDRTVPSPVLAFEPANRTLALASAFVQDEIMLAPDRVWITPGLRVLGNDYTGLEYHPGLRLRWKPAAGQMVWAAASRAVRLPSRLDTDLRFTGPADTVLIAGSQAFRSETVVALEAGLRASLPRASIDLAVFDNRYDDLRSQRPGGPDDDAAAVVDNDLNGRGRGVEVALQAQPAPWLRLHASYIRLATSTTVDAGRVDLGDGVLEFNDPDHQVDFRVYADLPRGFQADAFLRYASELPHPVVPAYAELDARLGWVSAAGHEFSIIGRNLLHDRHPEFGDPGPRRYEFERAVLLRSTWRF